MQRQNKTLMISSRMSTSTSTIDFLLDQLSSLSSIRARKMFGEYALYLHEKVVALVCDNHLFVKMTDSGEAFLEGDVEKAPAYPGSKPYLKIPESILEDRERLRELMMRTEQALPEVKKKKKA